MKQFGKDQEKKEIKKAIAAMSCGLGQRHGSDPVLLWLWHRPAATAQIRPLAWESPYAMGVAPEKARGKKKKERERKQ